MSHTFFKKGFLGHPSLPKFDPPGPPWIFNFFASMKKIELFQKWNNITSVKKSKQIDFFVQQLW